MKRIFRRSSLAFGTAATALCRHSLGAKRTVEADQRRVCRHVGHCRSRHDYLQCCAAHHGFVHQCGGCDSYRDLLPVCHCNRRTLPVCGNHKRRGTQGAGDTMPPLYYTIVSQWLIRLPTAYLLAFTLGYNILGVWVTIVIFSALQGVLTVRKFAAGDWKRRTI